MKAAVLIDLLPPAFPSFVSHRLASVNVTVKFFMHVDAACSAAPHRLFITAAKRLGGKKAHIYIIKFAPSGPYGSTKREMIRCVINHYHYFYCIILLPSRPLLELAVAPT